MNHSEKVLCIGDIILDSYCFGKVDRVSPEAPIPVLKLTKNQTKNLGGSGNVARNIIAADSPCHLISVTGNDDDAKIIKMLCKEIRNLTHDFVIDKTRPTTKKTRFVSENQQILRVDSESNKIIKKDVENKIINLFNKKIDNFGVVVISDYDKGMLSKNLIKKIISISNKKNKITIVDPKKEDFGYYENATIITPNLKELVLATKSFSNDKENNVESLSKKIINEFSFQAVVTTKSSDGITVVEKNKKSFHLPSKAKEVFDVSGAGDTVVSYIASELSKKNSLIDSVKTANKAAGLAVGKFGTAVVSRNEIDRIGKTNLGKILTLNEILIDLKTKENVKKIIGFTNGCFDLIHQGHIDYLKKARSQCDLLILALNSDLSVRKIKGNSRPIIDEKERSFLLSNFGFIDKILIFNEETPIKIIKKIKPMLIFKGDDYVKEDVVGYNESKKWNGKVVLIKCTKGISTSKIIQRIKYET